MKNIVKDAFIPLRHALAGEVEVSRIHLLTGRDEAMAAWSKFYTETFDHVTGPNSEQ